MSSEAHSPQLNNNKYVSILVQLTNCIIFGLYTEQIK